MASTIQLKRGTGSAVPSGLADGELAINLDNGKLYFGSGSSSENDFTFTNVSASGGITSSGLLTPGIVSASKFIGGDSVQTHLYKFINDTIRIAESSTGDNLRVYGGGLEVNGGAITASGDISASGTITATSFVGEIYGGSF